MFIYFVQLFPNNPIVVSLGLLKRKVLDKLNEGQNAGNQRSNELYGMVHG